MSPCPSRTVTGVSTSRTCTLTLACVSWGGTWTSTPGFEGRGPEGACAWAAMPVRGRRAIAVLTKRPHWPTKLDGRVRLGAQAGPETTMKLFASPSIAYTLAPAPTNQRLCYQGECT